jgi:hypothetical protein
MISANEVITDALEEIVVQADEADIEPSEGEAALRILNDMMAMWRAKGVNLGYSTISSLGGYLTVPRGAILGIKYNLAIALAEKYDVMVSPQLVTKARDAWEAILELSHNRLEESEYPDTLPTGSGNYSFYQRTFY